MYRSFSGRENEDSGSKSSELRLLVDRALHLETHVARLALELEYPLIEYAICDLLVLSLALEALRHHTRIKVAPVWHVFAQFVLLVYLLSPALDHVPDFLLDTLEILLVAFHSVEQLDGVLGQRFEFLFGVGLFADARTRNLRVLVGRLYF